MRGPPPPLSSTEADEDADAGAASIDAAAAAASPAWSSARSPAASTGSSGKGGRQTVLRSGIATRGQGPWARVWRALGLVGAVEMDGTEDVNWGRRGLPFPSASLDLGAIL